MNLIFTSNDPESTKALIEHTSRILVFDLDGLHLAVAEINNPDGNIFQNHAATSVVLPYRNGALTDLHVAELNKSKKLSGKIKKGDSMRATLAVLHDLIGHDALHPDL